MTAEPSTSPAAAIDRDRLPTGHLAASDVAGALRLAIVRAVKPADG
jgi:hypothetical protein